MDKLELFHANVLIQVWCLIVLIPDLCLSLLLFIYTACFG